MPLLLLSCSREARDPQSLPSAGEHVLSGFTASLPGSPAPAAKTSLNVDAAGIGTLLWDDDDPVMISNGTDMMTLYIEKGGSTTGDLYSESVLMDGNDFYAVYPSNESASYSEGTFTAGIPASQTFVPGGIARETFPMIAVADENRNFAFRNAASVIALVPASADESLMGAAISSISITSAQNIAGVISVNIGEGGVIETDCKGSRNIKISGAGMKFGDPVYIVTAPGQYTDFTVRVSLQSGFALRSTLTEPVTVERSKWLRLEIPMSGGYTDISMPEPANCYVITKPGSYMFNAKIRGNGVVPPSCAETIEPEIGGVDRLVVYNLDGEDFLLEPINYNEGIIFFTTKEESLPVGSMLVSAVDRNGKALWSWHIWANPEVADVTLSNGQTWLNMNLGALHTGFSSAGYNGYYYQWGRKDPFLQKYTSGTSAPELSPFVSHASKIDGSIENAIAHPEIFYGGYKSGSTNIEDWASFDDNVKYYDLWNASCTGDDQKDLEPAKTMFDPCPAGYHVPVYSEVDSLMTLSSKAWTDNCKVLDDGAILFPASSYRYINLFADYWITGTPRAFFWCATPYNTGNKDQRRGYRPWFTTGGNGIGNSPRSYGVPVRCIKD